jgi:FMN phosphatase YigB (HAD superfamily)
MKALFFDLDYTIVHYDDDSLDDKMMLEWLKSEGVENPEKIYFSDTWTNLDERMKYFGIDLDTYRLEWRPRFPNIEMIHKKRLYDNEKIWINKGAKEFINDLTIPKALISNSAPIVVDWLLNEFGLGDSFDYIYKRPYDYDDIRKPDPKVASEVMKALSIESPSEIGMIGDSKTDIEFARNSGLISIVMYNNIEGTDLFFTNFNDMHTKLRLSYPNIFYTGTD